VLVLSLIAARNTCVLVLRPFIRTGEPPRPDQTCTRRRVSNSSIKKAFPVRQLRQFPSSSVGTRRSRVCFWAGNGPESGLLRGKQMGTRTAGANRSAARFATLHKPPKVRYTPPPNRAHLDDKAARRHGRLKTISRRLFEAFPRVFKYPPVPLAIAIGPKLCELMGPEFKPAEVRAFLHAWTSGPRYLKAVLRGEMRRNLDGSPAGVPEPKHRTAAKERLKAIGHSGARSDPRSR